ncbi:hypothetical protein T10_3650 [Trichinella papuae]|uniref:Uncharacterized protein n=1 Tax=Trichinella papuae TaxID=268474 RepID=A0A0V1MA16_9BILA|nr:hypothetical protein T10_3650 [Trichinella papuae]
MQRLPEKHEKGQFHIKIYNIKCNLQKRVRVSFCKHVKCWRNNALLTNETENFVSLRLLCGFKTRPIRLLLLIMKKDQK